MKALKILLCSLCFCSQLLAEGISDVYSNNKAVEAIEKEDLSKASEYLHKMLAEDPSLVAARLNLGTVYQLNQDPKSALSLLEELEKNLKARFGDKPQALDESLKKIFYITKFNIAFLMALEKSQQKKAVFKYGECLDIYPRDLAAKVNIELLTQSMKKQNKQDQKNKDDKEQKQDQKENKDKKDDQKKKQDQNKKNKQKKDKKKKKPKKFKENELKKQDVKRIFDELKRQEEKIRAKVNKQNKQEQNIEKDW